MPKKQKRRTRPAAAPAAAPPAQQAESEDEAEDMEADTWALGGGRGIRLDGTVSSGDEQDSDDEDEPGEGGEAKADEEMQVSFDFVDPREAHLGGVRLHLQSLLPSDIDMHGIASIVASQPFAGTIVQVGDDVYAFATVVSLPRHRNEACVAGLLEALCEGGTVAAYDAPQRAAVTAAIRDEGRRTGLLLCRRMLNLPPQVSPVMHEHLNADLEWVLEEGTADEKRDFDFDTLIQVADVSVEANSSQPFFAAFDEEVLAQSAEAGCVVTYQHRDRGRMQRHISVLPRAAYSQAAVEQMQSMIGP